MIPTHAPIPVEIVGGEPMWLQVFLQLFAPLVALFIAVWGFSRDRRKTYREQATRAEREAHKVVYEHHALKGMEGSFSVTNASEHPVLGVYCQSGAGKTESGHSVAWQPYEVVSKPALLSANDAWFPGSWRYTDGKDHDEPFRIDASSPWLELYWQDHDGQRWTTDGGNGTVKAG